MCNLQKHRIEQKSQKSDLKAFSSFFVNFVYNNTKKDLLTWSKTKQTIFSFKNHILRAIKKKF